MNYRKMGIKVVIFSILAAVLLIQLNISGYLITALTVFGVGSGFVLITLGDLSHFD